MREPHPCRRRVVPLATLGLCLPMAACALEGEAAETVLDHSDLERRCMAAVEAFRAAPGAEPATSRAEADTALEAARLLFESVDLRIQQALAAAIDLLEAPSVDEILATESELPEALQHDVLSLSGTGAEAAEAALGFESSVAGHQFLALHLTMLAWANGAVRSLMAGYGTRIREHVDAAVAADPTWEGAAPLRLRGRFLAQAPWPVGDAQAARESLERALEIAPLPIHHLFLGDLLFGLGDVEAAAGHWQQVFETEPDDQTERVYPFHRAMAEARLDAVARANGR